MKGSKLERAPGVWRLRVYVGRDPITGKKRQSSKEFRGGARAADTALAEFVSTLTGLQDGTGASLATTLDAYCDHCERVGRTPRTMEEYRRQAKAIRKTMIGQMPVVAVKARHLDRLYDAMATKGLGPGGPLSPASIQRYHALISAALGLAFKWEWVTENVAKKASPPSVPGHPMTVPSIEELLLMVTEGEKASPVLGTAIALAALTGARRGELCALRWTDVGSESLTIARSISVVAKVTHEGETKTHQARTISLDPLGLATLDRRRQEVDRVARAAGVKVDRDGFILSPRADGARPMLPDTLTHRFGDLMVAMGLQYHLHQLRHFSVTTLIAAGHDARTVATRHGHADASTTLRVYSHALQAQDQLAAATLGRALTPALATPVVPELAES